MHPRILLLAEAMHAAVGFSLLRGDKIMASKLSSVVKVLLIMFYDALCVAISGGLALLVRFDFSFGEIPRKFLAPWAHFLPYCIAITIACFLLMRMYRYVWHNISVNDVARMAVSVFLAFVIGTVISVLLGNHQPRSVIFMQFVFQIVLLVGGRCFFRFWDAIHWTLKQARSSTSQRIMLVGAGEAGHILARELLTNRKIDAKLCCVIDDDENKWGRYFEGTPIVGGRNEIPSVARNEGITQILVAMPSAPPEDLSTILNICNSTGVHTKTLPGVYQFVTGEVSLSNVRDVQVEDLLGRAPVQLNTQVVDEFISGKTILVTGCGGSIGSEICRQIAKRDPKRLIILDIYENNAYDIQQELSRAYGSKLDLCVVIASIRDKERIYELFDELRPDIVFHAAAHKHVPLMEACPAEAIKNNIFGTYHVVRAAEKYGVAKFVMISTDKAVNPTNVMGATKRFCEMILQSRLDRPTEFCAVRFGNVLGSNGSVVPLFKRQIEEGGPVTITDKRIIRYFMTIPEAAQLVMEAGAIAKQGQIFVLDMGEPVRILDLAEKLIRLSGYEPYRDIEIKEIGLRPGEKLYEELLMKSETLSKTENKKIFVEQQQEISPEQIMEDLKNLDRAITVDCLSDQELISMLRSMIPTYHAPEEVNRKAVIAIRA